MIYNHTKHILVQIAAKTGQKYNDEISRFGQKGRFGTVFGLPKMPKNGDLPQNRALSLFAFLDP